MNRQSRRKAIVVLVLFLAATCVARADEIDDFIRAEMQRQNIPGLSFAVIRDGNIIKAEGYGLADIKLKMPAQAGTIFKIASVSKQFIATGIMLLVQEAQLDLDDPISRYLEGTPATWKGITIRHLLTHTSGLVREGPGFDARKIQSDADVIKSAYSLPLRFAPGEKWEYCNLGYFALAEIIRKVSGRPWTEYLNEKVFRPSGMSTTYPTNTKVELPNRAQGYVDNAKLLEADEWVALRPSGAFLSTVLDMAKWDAVLYTDKVLSESSRQAMWTPVKLNDGATYPYGFGWYVGSIRGRKLVHHGGGGPGARAWFARFVDDRLTVILLMNLDDVDPESIVHGVAAFYLRAPTVDLAKDYRVIEWTAGATARVINRRDPPAYGAEMGKDIVRLLDHLKIQRAHIVGFSIGAIIVGHLLTTDADRFLSATLVAHPAARTWTAKDEQEAEAYARDLESDTPFRLLILGIQPPGTPLPRDDEIRTLSQRFGAANEVRALAAFNRGRRGLVAPDAQLAAVRVPTLGIIGSADPAVAGMRDLKTVMPALTVIVVDGATHGGEHGLLQRAEFLASLRDFFAASR